MDKYPQSTFAVAGHPLHPILVTLPIGFLIGALLSDVAFLVTTDPFWARAAFWLTGAGILTGIVAALGGFVDFAASSAIRRLSEAWWHFAGNGVVLVLAAVSFYSRLGNESLQVTSTQLILSVCIVALLGLTGWLGGEMVFRRRVGVQPASAAKIQSPTEGNPND